MFKKLLITFVLMTLFCFTVKANESFTTKDDGFTIGGVGANNITGLRVGYQWGNLDTGLLTYWDEDNDFREALGAYVFYSLPGEFDTNDISWLPNGITTVNYLGMQGTFDIDGDDEDSGFFGPTFGMVLKKFIIPSSNERVQTIAEVQYVNYYGDLEDRISKTDEMRFMLGMKIKF